VSASKFTPEVRGALIERTGLGLSLADACRSVGVREATVKGWLTRGRREGSGDYAEFVAAIERAREAARERPDPMDADELARVVSEMARKARSRRQSSAGTCSPPPRGPTRSLRHRLLRPPCAEGPATTGRLPTRQSACRSSPARRGRRSCRRSRNSPPGGRSRFRAGAAGRRRTRGPRWRDPGPRPSGCGESRRRW
jgi:hypothetical protein